MEFVPISQLSPSLDSQNTKRIRAVVALIWPYSSSNQSLSLLLVEPDFRLRLREGQVRVHFAGKGAEALAKSNISSGDEVVLNLDGAGWTRPDAGVSTPGKSVGWDLLYRQAVSLEVSFPYSTPLTSKSY